MRSTVVLALTGLLLLQAADLGSVLAPRQCSDGCPADRGQDDCAPLCPDCGCCPTLRTGIQADILPSTPPLSALVIETARQCLPSSAEPADIFHIPKTPLA